MNERIIPLGNFVADRAWKLAIARAGNGAKLADVWPAALAEVALLAETLEKGAPVQAIPDGAVAQLVSTGTFSYGVKITVPPMAIAESRGRG